jgi:hypothetical protein
MTISSKDLGETFGGGGAISPFFRNKAIILLPLNKEEQYSRGVVVHQVKILDF